MWGLLFYIQKLHHELTTLLLSIKWHLIRLGDPAHGKNDQNCTQNSVRGGVVGGLGVAGVGDVMTVWYEIDPLYMSWHNCLKLNKITFYLSAISCPCHSPSSSCLSKGWSELNPTNICTYTCQGVDQSVKFMNPIKWALFVLFWFISYYLVLISSISFKNLL